MAQDKNDTDVKGMFPVVQVTIDDMPKKTVLAPPPAEVADVRRILDLLHNTYGFSQAEIADFVGVKRPTVGNWLKGVHNPGEGDHPRSGAVVNLRKMERHVAESLIKPRRPNRKFPLPSAKPLGSGVSRQHQSASRKGVTDMELSARLERLHEATYPQLELCLLYHQAEIDAGDISRAVVLMGRDGQFEGRGCREWSAQEWWLNIVEAEELLRAQYGQPTSGTMKKLPQ
jgi:Homeodomain-like domain-containing protein